MAVHLYAGGAAGKGGTIVAATMTSLTSTPGVITACGIGAQHTFQFVLSAAQLAKFHGQKVYVHGISLNHTGNLALSQSGKFTFPASAAVAASGKVIGNVDGVVQSGGQLYVSGWACDQGVKHAIAVHLYLGGPAGTGTIVSHATASRPSSALIASNKYCGTGLLTHRFLIPVPAAKAEEFSKQTIWVHGISLSDGANLAIGQSGLHRLP
jgi:hypothetical protein